MPSWVSIAFILIIIVALIGCGGPVQQHSTAIRVTTGFHAVGGAVVDEARGQALDRVTEETADLPRAERERALHTEAARWDPLGAALDTVKTILESWLDVVEAVEAGAESLWSRVPALISRLVRLWGDVVRLAGALGVGLPELPDQVTSLTNMIGVFDD